MFFLRRNMRFAAIVVHFISPQPHANLQYSSFHQYHVSCSCKSHNKYFIPFLHFRVIHANCMLGPLRSLSKFRFKFSFIELDSFWFQASHLPHPLFLVHNSHCSFLVHNARCSFLVHNSRFLNLFIFFIFFIFLIFFAFPQFLSFFGA